ncbi:MAG: PKD domain-containing protein [Terricaulis sp.]
MFAGARANYYIFTSGGNVVVHDLVGTDGTDTLSNVENLQFTDGTIASTGFTSNEAPVSNAGGPYYAQVGQAVTLVGTASDPDTAEGDVITYAWDFNDDGIVGDSTVLSPTLSGVDIAGFGLGVGDHTITLRVTDAAGIARDSAVTLTIAASAAPVISSDGGGATASVNVAENTTAVTTVVATDANLNDTVTYALSGADAALFTLDASTGVLTFNAAPDHETPADAGGDNIYNVTVTASDNGALTDTQDIAITVTDAADAVNGTAGDDVITAHPAGGAYNLLGGADTFTGGASADLVTGGEGNDAIDGGGGADTAVFSGARANYYIYTSGANVVVHDLVGTDGTDTLTDVESLQFSDATIASSGFAANAAPVVSAGGPYYAQVGQAVVIAATANDANTADGDVISYAWDLDNDGQFDDAATLSPTLSGADITTLGLGVGDHTITLRVTDAAGVATTSAVTLTIAASAAPVISSNGGGATASLQCC